MTLARRVLALHEGIREVFVLEERSGEYAVVDEATRNGVSLLSESMHETRKHAPLVPALILGAAAQLTGNSLKLIGILYREGGVVFTHIDEKRLVALSSAPENLYKVMEAVNDTLPGLLEREFAERAGGVESAAEAEDIARSFFVGRLRGSILVDEVYYRAADHRWMVHGSHRSSRWVFSKRFQVELDADNRSVMRFASTSPVRRHKIFFLLAELACVTAAALVVVWMIQYIRWR
jgi:hypothetical protein